MAEGASTKRPGTILVVEDDHDTRVALRHALEGAGYFVISTTNGASALELLGKMTSPSVILLDINMPLMNGDQFLEVIRTHPEFGSIPVVQMSAATNHRRQGTCAAIQKPIDLNELIRLIERCY